MEFWEGAILVVGGVWLVGHMSRRSAAHPLNQNQPTYSAVPTLAQSTNTAGTSSLVAGESLTQPTGSQLVKSGPVSLPASGTPVARPIYKAGQYMAF